MSKRTLKPRLKLCGRSKKERSEQGIYFLGGNLFSTLGVGVSLSKTMKKNIIKAISILCIFLLTACSSTQTEESTQIPEVVYQSFEGMTFGPYGGINASTLNVSWKYNGTEIPDVIVQINSVDFEDIHFLATIPNISKIQFCCCNFDSLNGFEQLKSVNSLDFYGCTIPTGERLPYLPKLKTIEVEESNFVTDDIITNKTENERKIDSNFNSIFYDIEGLVTDENNCIEITWGVFDDFRLCAWIESEYDMEDYSTFENVPGLYYVHINAGYIPMKDLIK